MLEGLEGGQQSSNYSRYFGGITRNLESLKASNAGSNRKVIQTTYDMGDRQSLIGSSIQSAVHFAPDT